MRRFLDLVVSVLSKAGIGIGTVLIGLMVVHIAAEVTSRTIFGRPLVGTVEIVAYYYMIAVAFLPLGYVQDRHEHIEAEAIAGIVPVRWRRATNLIGAFLSIAVTAGLLYASVLSALRQTQFGAAVMLAYGELPIWVSRWFLPIGFGSMLVFQLYQVFVRGDVVAVSEDATHAPTSAAS